MATTALFSTTLFQEIQDYNIKDYGAVCDGVTDDAAAINACITAARTTFDATPSNVVRIVFPSGTKCLVKSTLDFTGIGGSAFFGYGLVVSGGHIIGQTSGTPVIDAIGSRYIHWENITIVGASTPSNQIPSVGMQFGRRSQTINADEHTFTNVTVVGTYTFACVWNLGSEDAVFIHPIFINNSTASGTYALVMDGYNHFNVSSAFQTVTWTSDTKASFNGNTFVGGMITSVAATSKGIPVWIGAAHSLQFINTYIAGIGSYGIVLYQLAANDFINLNFECHIETSALTDCFLVSGTNASAVISGLKFHDHNVNPSNSIFKLDTGVTAVTVSDIDLSAHGFVAAGCQVFDSPPAWNITGKVYVNGATHYSTGTIAAQKGTYSSGAGNFSVF